MYLTGSTKGENLIKIGLCRTVKDSEVLLKASTTAACILFLSTTPDNADT